MIKKHWRYLGVLWLFVLLSFALFQNFNQELDKITLHNDSCKQALDTNQGRILNINSAQSNLTSVWPKETSDISQTLRALNSTLIESNQKLYSDCQVEGSVIQLSHQIALEELNKLTDANSNLAIKEYISLVDSAYAQLKGVR